MFVKNAFQSPPLYAASERVSSAALPGSGAVDNQPSHKVTLGEGLTEATGFVDPAGGTHNCTTRMNLLNRRTQLLLIQAVDSESQSKYDFDQEKARQALDELDQEFDSLLKKQVPLPKIRASNLSDTLRDQMKGEEPVFSGPSLAYGAFALFAFTILYNILFLTVIKPSIDSPEEVAAPVAPSREALSSGILQMLLSDPLAPDIIVAEL